MTDKFAFIVAINPEKLQSMFSGKNQWNSNFLQELHGFKYSSMSEREKKDFKLRLTRKFPEIPVQGYGIFCQFIEVLFLFSVDLRE